MLNGDRLLAVCFGNHYVTYTSDWLFLADLSRADSGLSPELRAEVDDKVYLPFKGSSEE